MAATPPPGYGLHHLPIGAVPPNTVPYKPELANLLKYSLEQLAVMLARHLGITELQVHEKYCPSTWGHFAAPAITLKQARKVDKLAVAKLIREHFTYNPPHPPPNF